MEKRKQGKGEGWGGGLGDLLILDCMGVRREGR